MNPTTGDFSKGPKLPLWLAKLLHHKWRFHILAGVLVLVGSLVFLGLKMPWKTDRTLSPSEESSGLAFLNTINGKTTTATPENTEENQPTTDESKNPDGSNKKDNNAGGSSSGGSDSSGDDSGGSSPGGGSNPGTYSKPTSATVGVRYAPTRTLTASQALTELRSTGRLSRATVTGMFSLSGSDGAGWVMEDVRFEGGYYGIRGYMSGSAFSGSQSQRPVFRHVDVLGTAALGNGGCSTVVYGRDIILEYADISGCSDGIKAGSNFELYHSWVHDMDHPAGAHADAVQIRFGTNMVFKGNRFDAYIGYSSDGSQTPAGDTANGVLQTGTVTDNISALWENNWFAGGHYTIRGGGDDARVEYVFRNNRFMRHGTSVALGLTNLPPNRYGSASHGVSTYEVWENNVWDDTGQIVN